MELSVTQLAILGLVTTVVVQLAKLLLAKFGYNTSRLVTTIVVVVVSVGLGYAWLLPKLPSVSDPMELATALLQTALAVFAFATLIYNVLLDQIFKALGWTKS